MLPTAIRGERRRTARAPLEIQSIEDARRLVQRVQQRSVENHFGVKAWRLAKQSAWLLLLVVCFLVYYLIGVIAEVLSLL